MANIKFSQFTQKTTLGTVDFLVGYTGADNVQIDPADLLSDYSQGTGAAGQVTFFSAASTVTGDNDLYWDNTNKRLGIKTTTPGVSLDIFGSGLRVTTNAGALSAGYFAQLYSDYGSNALRLKSRAGDVFRATDFGQAVSILTGTTASGTSERLHINSSGNVGIGTSSPSAKLHVDGTLIATGVSQLGSGGANVYLTSSSAGSVGIGTSSPAYKLDVTGDSSSGVIAARNSANGRDTFRSENAAGTRTVNIGNDANGHGLVLVRASGGTVTNYITGNGNSYFNAGNVGIGTSSPAFKTTIYSSGTTDSFPLVVGQGNAANEFVGIGLSGFIASNGAVKAAMVLNRDSTYGVGDIHFLNNTTQDNTNATLSDSRLVIKKSGNVGIGTTTPLGELHVKDVGAIYTSLSGSDSAVNFVEGGGNPWRIGNRSADDSFRFSQSSSSLGTNVRFIIANGGNVGIGTTSPDTILEVVNDVDNSSNTALDVNAGIIIHNGDSSGTAVLKLRGSGGDSGAVVFGGGGGAASDKFHVISRHNQTKRFTVQANGNVGIGTSSPQAALHVSGPFNTNAPTGNGVLMGYYNSTHGYIQLNGSSGGYIDFSTSGVDHKGRILYDNTSNYFRFDTDGTERMRIDSSGNVGIGTTSPSSKLEISEDSSSILNLYRPNSSTAAASFLDFNFNTANGTKAVYARIRSDVETNTDSGQGGDLSFHTANAGTISEVMRLTENGNVGIGSTSPTSKLTVAVGDIETSGVGYGIILKSPNGTRYRVTVDNSGNLSTTAV